MRYTVQDLIKSQKQTLAYIKIFETIMHQDQIFEETFDDVSKEYSEYFPDTSILLPIIKEGRVDILLELYDNNIQIHTYECVVSDILYSEQPKLFELIYDHGYNIVEDEDIHSTFFESMHDSYNNKNNKMVIYILDLYALVDQQFITKILLESIEFKNVEVRNLILGDQSSYPTVSDILTKQISNLLLRRPLLINKELINILESAGCDMSPNIDDFLLAILKKSNIPILRYLTTRGANFLEIINTL